MAAKWEGSRLRDILVNDGGPDFKEADMNIKSLVISLTI